MSIKNKQSTMLSKTDERLIYAMQLLGDKTRYKIFKLLTTDDELCVSEIAAELSVTSSTISQHFRNFELVGLVDKQRNGQKICYMLTHDDPLVNQLKSIVNT